MEVKTRPAFYALKPGAWRDYITLIHLPYTLWHLSYVVIGASVAPTLNLYRLSWTLLAFFLAVGIAAHALDELRDRPLRTHIPSWVLMASAGVSLVGAALIGLKGLSVSPRVLIFVAFGVFIVTAYNLELFGGLFHNPFWFAFAWGAFPMLTSFWISALHLNVSAILVASACFTLSLAQRTLSQEVRTVRRKAVVVRGVVQFGDGSELILDKGVLIGGTERALQLLTVTIILIALGLLLFRLAL